MKPLFPFYFLFSLALLSGKLHAAACCGGGFAAPSLVAGDEKAQITMSYAFTDITVDHVDARGVWHKWDVPHSVETFKLEAARVFADRFQAGFSAPLVKRSRADQNFSGLGDVTFNLGYEFLPDWDYNLMRPKGLGYLQLTLPTGKARAESLNGGLDSRGTGFWSLGVGSLLTKTLGDWDLFLNGEIHRSFAKSVNTELVRGRLEPGYGGNFGLGGGYNWKDWRLGTSLTWTYEDPVDIEGASPSKGLSERYATAVASLSYLHKEAWAATLSYADQTLIGSPSNTSLGSTVAVQIQHRLPR